LHQAVLAVTSHVGRDLLQSAAVFKHEHTVVWEYVSNGLQYVETSRPVVTVAREDLEQFCVDQRGMNFHTFYVYLSYSSLVLRLAQGVYSLVGADFPIGAVEAVQSRQKRPAAATQHGWHDDGRLWCTMQVDRLALNVGVRSVPVFVAQLTQGEWQVFFSDGVGAGSLNVTEQSISQLKVPLAMVGAELGDTLRLKFDLQMRKVWIEVGGDVLEPGSSPPDESDELADEEDDDL
jgi:hypothetical protein